MESNKVIELLEQILKQVSDTAMTNDVIRKQNMIIIDLLDGQHKEQSQELLKEIKELTYVVDRIDSSIDSIELNGKCVYNELNSSQNSTENLASKLIKAMEKLR